MTIPSRPAPAPPGARGQSAAAGANASLEQLRLQLQQQHMQQQQSAHGGLQKLSIKLPPPPKGPVQPKKSSNNNNNNSYDVEGGSSITRKFPQARYTPATNWNDSPFNGVAAAANNGNISKKMPPPRPPPPKMQLNGRKLSSLASGNSGGGGGAAGGGSIISNIFHRKKSTGTATAAASKAAAQSRAYAAATTTTTATSSNSNSGSSNGTSFTNYDWNAAWNTASTTTTTTMTTSNVKHAASSSCQPQRETDGQLISFDSPPASPTFTQKSNSDCVSVDSFSSDSNFSSPNNGSVSQPESGFEDDYSARSRPATQSPLVDPWEAVDSGSNSIYSNSIDSFAAAPVRQMQPTTLLNTRSSDNPLCNGKSLLPPTQSLTMPTIIKPKISQKPKAPKPPPFIGQPPGYAYGYSAPPSPPMPKCAPPPLDPAGHISMLDVISGKVDPLALSNGSSGYVEETQLPYAIALYDFDGAEEGDLSFRENEKIYLLEQPTEDWYRGRTRSGCEGLFPVNYVETKVPLRNSASGAPQTQPQPQQQQQHHQQQQQQHQQHQQQPQQQQLNTARCMYNFPGEVDGDLTLRENELVTVLYRINEDWLFGEADGRQGQFPTNFLDNVPENLPSL